MLNVYNPKCCGRHFAKIMQLHIYAPWKRTEKAAHVDRAFLRKLFRQNVNHGLETVRLTDHKEYRADIEVGSDRITVSSS